MSTYVVRERGFSLDGFQFYRKHKKDFTPKSVFSLLQTREGWKTRSKTGLICHILRGDYTINRDGRKHLAIPQEELKDGDIVIMYIPMGNLEWKVDGERLIRVK